MMRRFFAAVLAGFATLSSLVATPAEARRQWQAMGGRGDANTVLECPAGQVLVGFEGHAGSWINQMRIICAPLTGDFTTGPARGFGGFFGGAGGGPAQAVCPGDSVMTRIGFFLTPDKGRVARVGVQCTRSDGSVFQATFGSYGAPTEGCGKYLLGIPQGCDPDEGARVQTCPQEHVVGLTVHSGADVNAIGLICDRRDPLRAASFRVTPPPAPDNRPIKHTGAGSGGPVGSYLGAPFAVTSTPGLPFQLIMHEDEGPGAMWGELKFADPRYNGTLIGKLRPGGMMFDFTYEQPDAGISGSGKMAIFSGGKLVSGEVTTNEDQPRTFKWVGRR